jgi:two-component system sensor histidine kinase YesM
MLPGIHLLASAFRTLKKTTDTFRFRLVMVSILTAIMPVLAIGLSMYFISIRSLQNVSLDFAAKLVSQVSLNIDDNIRQLDRVVISVIMDEGITDVLKKYSRAVAGPQVDLADMYAVSTNLMNKASVRDDILGIYMFSTENHAFYAGLSPSLEMNYDVRRESWYARIVQQGGLWLLPTEIPRRYLRKRNDYVFSLVRSVNDYRTNTSVGTLVMDVKLDLFKRIFANTKLSDSQQLFVLDSDGNLIYGTGGALRIDPARDATFGEISRNRIDAGNGSSSLVKHFKGGHGLVIYCLSPYTKWQVASYITPSYFSVTSRTIRYVTIGLMLFSGLLTAIIIILIVFRVFKPIAVLREGMHQVRQGNFNVAIQNYDNDEIGSLCDTFNMMTKDLKVLIEKVKELEEKNREVLIKKAAAELDALQAQINPHFLYNTLGSISLMAELNNDDETQKMAVALGKLIRLSVNKGGTSVSVSQEIEHVRNYLLIQKIRFGNKFDVEFRIDNAIMDLRIPKFILQPIVENSIYHGLETKPGKGIITISGSLEGNEVVFRVNDNGWGMDSEKLAKVSESIKVGIADTYESSRSIGLANVNQRIKLHYADDRYGLWVESRKDEGTTIRVNVPIATKECEAGAP